MRDGGRAAINYRWRGILSTEKLDRSGFRRRTDASLRQERGRASGGPSSGHPEEPSYVSRVRSVTDACLAGERAEVDEALGCLLDLLKDEELALAASENDVAVRESLIHTFSHELRTLLNALTVDTGVLLKREGKTREKTGAGVQRTVQRMERLLTSMIESLPKRNPYSRTPLPEERSNLPA